VLAVDGLRRLRLRPWRAASILAAVHFAELTAPEQRVLGCLIEKRWTTPDQYPLSLNALRLACNQATNRDPVTTYDETTVRNAAQRLSHYGLTRLASGHSSRAIKYRHLAEEALGLDREQLAILSVLLLRGPQTPGELKSRSDRMASLPSLADVERVLGELSERGYARRIARRPGQKEDRFEQLLGGDGEATADDRSVEHSEAGGRGLATAEHAPSAASAPSIGPAPSVAPAPSVGTAPSAGPAPVAAVADRSVEPVAASPAERLAPSSVQPVAPRPPEAASQTALEMRVTALESEVRQLRAALEALRSG
jgi:uncharacterized protein